MVPKDFPCLSISECIAHSFIYRLHKYVMIRIITKMSTLPYMQQIFKM